MTYDYMAKGRGVHGEVMDGWMLPDILAPGTSNIHTAPPLLPGATSQHQINLNKLVYVQCPKGPMILGKGEKSVRATHFMSSVTERSRLE